jgi:NTP pyrophosphatase (non-canonical NTP hydrolase)
MTEDRDELPMPRLFPIELERLALLSEELGEAQKAIGKILRHGFYSHNPDDPEAGQNYAQLETELGDVLAAIDLLAIVAPIKRTNILRRVPIKLQKVQKYLHHKEPTP